MLVRPFADRLDELARRWAQAPGSVLAWMSPQVALGVFFHRSTNDRDRWAGRERADPLGTPVAILHPRPTAAGCPVYFDFEGSWSHLSGVSGARGYPRGLPAVPSEELGGTDGWSPRQRWAGRELLTRPFDLERAGRAGHLVGPLGLPFAQKRLLAEGWVLHRVLADVSRLPAYHDRRMDRIVFVAGELRSGVAPESLFMTLTRDCRVFPFLFASEGPQLLFGALGQGGVAPGPPASTEQARRPVMPTLRQALTHIQFMEEATTALRTVVDHRYDRLAPPDVAKGSPAGPPPPRPGTTS